MVSEAAEVVGAADEVISAAEEMISDAVESIAEEAAEIGENVADAVTGIIDEAKAKAEEKITEAGEKVGEYAEAAEDAVKIFGEKAQEAAETAKEAAEGAVETAKAGIDTAKEKAGEAAGVIAGIAAAIGGVSEDAEEAAADIESVVEETAADIESIAEETAADIESKAEETAADIESAAEETAADIESAAEEAADAIESAVEEAADAVGSAAEEAAAAPQDGEVCTRIKEAGKVVMTTNAEFEPFEYKDGEDIIGIDVDIANAIAEKLGVELEIVDIAFNSLIPSLNAGKADFIAAGMTATDERRKNVDFTQAYFNASQAIIVKIGSDIAGREDLNDRVVGVQEGTTGDYYCTNEDGSSDINVKEVKRYSKGMDAVYDLLLGRIDAVVIDNFPADKLVERNSDKIVKLDEALTEEEYSIALPIGSDLTPVIDEVIDELKASGRLDEIISAYISAE